MAWLAILNVTAAIALFLACFPNDIRIRSRIRVLEEQAQSLSLSVAPPACSEIENAATLWAELLAEGLPRPLPDREFSKSPDSLHGNEWIEYLSEHKSVIERIRDAAARPRCRFNLDWSRANMLDERPELATISSSILLLYADGLRAVLGGDAKPAFANAAALRQVAEQLTDDPRRHAQMTLGMAEGRAWSLLGRALYLRPPTVEELALLRNGRLQIWENNSRVIKRSEAEHYTAIRDIYLEGDIQRANAHVPGHGTVLRLSLAASRLLFADDDTRDVPEYFAKARKESSGSAAEFGNRRALSQMFRTSAGGLVYDRLVFLGAFPYLRAVISRKLGCGGVVGHCA